DDKTGVEQYGGPHARLDVLKNQVLPVLVGQLPQVRGQIINREAVQIDAERPMTQETHFFQAQGANIHFRRGYTEMLHEGAGVTARPARGAKTGHGKGPNAV